MNNANTTYTPGPWTLRTVNGKTTVQQDKPRYTQADLSNHRLTIATLCKHRFGSADPVPGCKARELAGWEREGTQDANARLIAAAPELLAALETAYAVMTSARVEVYNHDRANYSRIENAIDAARAAIAKAKGEPAHG